MSALSEQVRIALYGKVNVSGVTSLATGGIFHGEAKLSSSYPLVVIDKSSNVPSYTFGFTLALEDSLWLLKAYVDESCSTSKSPLGLGEEIIAAAVTAIGQSLTLSAGTCYGVMRMGDLPILKEQISDRNVWMVGVMLRIWAV